MLLIKTAEEITQLLSVLRINNILIWYNKYMMKLIKVLAKEAKVPVMLAAGTAAFFTFMFVLSFARASEKSVKEVVQEMISSAE